MPKNRFGFGRTSNGAKVLMPFDKGLVMWVGCLKEVLQDVLYLSWIGLKFELDWFRCWSFGYCDRSKIVQLSFAFSNYSVT